VTAANRNGVDILINKNLKDEASKRCGNQIILIKLVELSVISAYAPQVGHNKNLKRKFQEGLEDMVGVYRVARSS
jgi:hypothetical protein